MSLRRAIAALGVASLITAACSGGGSKAADSSSTTRKPSSSSTTSAGSGSPSTTGKTSSGNGDLTVVAADESALPDTPPMVVATYGSTNRPGWGAYYYEHLSGDAKTTFGGPESKDSYLLSPDVRYAAVGHDGDAVNGSRLQIIALDTGQAAATFEVDADRLNVLAWSPDSSAVLVGAVTNLGRDAAWKVYRTDGTSQPAPASLRISPIQSSTNTDFLRWTRPNSGTYLFDCGARCVSAALQLVSSKGVPVVLAWHETKTSYPPEYEVGRFDPNTLRIVPFAGSFGKVVPDRQRDECGPIAVLTSDDGPTAIFDADTLRVTPVPVAIIGPGCPIVSPDGKRVAFGAADGSRVVDLATEKVTRISREGSPIIWSKDGSHVLVKANGTFVVAADGSGGKQASFDVQNSCALGDSGRLVSVTGTSAKDSRTLTLYDMATDSATALGEGTLAGTCEVDADGQWLVSGRTVVDVDGGHATVVSVSRASDRRLGDLHLFAVGSHAALVRR